MATSSNSPPSAPASPAPTEELLPGYFVEPSTGAWLTLPPFPVGEIPTIGYDVIRWVERWLHNHLSGLPWRYRPGQVNFNLWWYALAGPGPVARWLMRSGIRRGAKGSGKDPHMATLAMAELCGPTLPIWTGSQWVGRQHPFSLVQIGANSEGQAKDVLMVANAMVDPEMVAEFGIDKGILRTQLTNGSRIEVLTTSEKSAEGDPATAVFLNETHHMKPSNGGDQIAGVGRRNAGKSPGGMCRVCEFTNAHMPGEESVAEGSFEAWQLQASGKTRRIDILYDSREAPPHLSLHDEAQLMAGLRAAYADSPWSDLERIAAEAQDPRVPIADAIRYYFSSLPTAATAWVNPRQFDALAAPDIVTDGEAIALFLDCSKSQDATALAGSRMTDGHAMALGLWQRPHGDRDQVWRVPREEVDAVVRAMFERYDVQWFGVDVSPAVEDESEVSYWGPLVDAWHRDFRDKVLVWATPGLRGSAVSWDLRQSQPGGRERLREFTAVAEQTAQAIDERKAFTWDGDPALRLHVHNARRRPNEFGVSLGKKSRNSTQLVDYAVAMVGAQAGRRAVLNSGKSRKRKTGRAAF